MYMFKRNKLNTMAELQSYALEGGIGRGRFLTRITTNCCTRLYWAGTPEIAAEPLLLHCRNRNHVGEYAIFDGKLST